MQVVVITDPLLATHVLNSRLFDKWRFSYSFLDPVCVSSFRVLPMPYYLKALFESTKSKLDRFQA